MNLPFHKAIKSRRAYRLNGQRIIVLGDTDIPGWVFVAGKSNGLDTFFSIRRKTLFGLQRA